MAEELRLDATVVDRFSKPLGELRAKMQAVTRTGAAGTKSTSVEFERFHANVARVTQSLRGGLEPSLAAVGLGGLSAGPALGGVAGAVAGIVSAIEIKNLASETGIAAATIRQLQSVSEQFGVQSDAVVGGLTAFAGKVYDVKRGVSDLIPELGRLKGGAELIESLKIKPGDEALKSAFDFLTKQPEGERRNRIAEALFGTRDFSRLVQGGIGKLNEAMADAAKRQPFISDEDLKKAREYEGQVANLKDRFDELSHSIGGVTIPWITDLVTGLDHAIEKGKSFVDLWSKMSGGDAGATKDLKTKLSEWNDYLGGMADSGRDSVVKGLKELFGIGSAGAARRREAQCRTGSEIARGNQGRG